MDDVKIEMTMQSLQKPSPNKSFFKVFPPQVIAIMFVQIAIVNGILVVGSIYLGKLLDASMNTRLLFTVGFAVVSLQLALFITYKLGMRAVAKTAQTDRQRSEQEQLATGNQPPENSASTDQPTFSVKSS